jgi:hypothetical protein
MNNNIILIVSLIFFFMGFIWIFGTWKNWKIFTDPNEDVWLMWLPNSIIKYGGVEAIKFLNYFFGVLFLIIGIIFATM